MKQWVYDAIIAVAAKKRKRPVDSISEGADPQFPIIKRLDRIVDLLSAHEVAHMGPRVSAPTPRAVRDGMRSEYQNGVQNGREQTLDRLRLAFRAEGVSAADVEQMDVMAAAVNAIKERYYHLSEISLIKAAHKKDLDAAHRSHTGSGTPESTPPPKATQPAGRSSFGLVGADASERMERERREALLAAQITIMNEEGVERGRIVQFAEQRREKDKQEMAEMQATYDKNHPAGSDRLTGFGPQNEDG